MFFALSITVLLGLQDASKVEVLIGRWESAERSKGGMGATWEFQKDGRLAQTIGLMRESTYRIKGDRLILGTAESPIEIEIPFQVAGDSMVQIFGSGEKQSRRVLRRIAKAEVVQGSVAGKWSTPYLTGTAVEEYTTDGQIHWRFPLSPPQTLHYTLEADTLSLQSMESPSRSTKYRVTVSDTSLALVELPGNKAYLFRREGARYQFVAEKPMEIGVQLGGDFLEKTVLISNSEIGDVTCIKVLPQKSDTDAKLIIAGNKGAVTLAKHDNVTSFVKFEKKVGTVEPIDVEGDGIFEYMNRGGGWQPVSLISSSGKTIWEYSPKDAAPDDMTCIDLNGDGVMEFVVGLNGRGGLKALSRGGKELWTQAAVNASSVASADLDGSMKILHTDYGGRGTIVIRSVKGDKLRTLEFPFISFALCKDPKDQKRQVLIGMDRSTIKAYDFEGTLVRSLPIKRWGRSLAATPIVLGDQPDTYFAVVVSLLASSNRSELYVYDRRDTLVYHELLAGKYPAVAKVPRLDGKGEVLLVGGADGTVTEYRLKKK
jgi:hypothetical protein